MILPPLVRCQRAVIPLVPSDTGQPKQHRFASFVGSAVPPVPFHEPPSLTVRALLRTACLQSRDRQGATGAFMAATRVSRIVAPPHEVLFAKRTQLSSNRRSSLPDDGDWRNCNLGPSTCHRSCSQDSCFVVPTRPLAMPFCRTNPTQRPPLASACPPKFWRKEAQDTQMQQFIQRRFPSATAHRTLPANPLRDTALSKRTQLPSNRVARPPIGAVQGCRQTAPSR
jgi:hypothetical protein